MKMKKRSKDAAAPAAPSEPSEPPTKKRKKSAKSSRSSDNELPSIPHSRKESEPDNKLRPTTTSIPALPAPAPDALPETPVQAYEDLKSLLDFAIKQLHNKLTSEGRTVKVYDPFFGQNSEKKLLEDVMNGDQAEERAKLAAAVKVASLKKAGKLEDEKEGGADTRAASGEQEEGAGPGGEAGGVDSSDKPVAKGGEKEEQKQPKLDKFQRAALETAKKKIPVSVEVIPGPNENFSVDPEVVVPAHDILVTTPPRSNKQKQKLLDFLLQRMKTSVVVAKAPTGPDPPAPENEEEDPKKLQKRVANAKKHPFCLLVNAKTVSQPWYRQFLQEVGVELGHIDHAVNDFEDSDDLEKKAEVFYIAPRVPYRFGKLAGGKSNQKNSGNEKFLWVCGGFRNYYGISLKFAPKKIDLCKADLEKKKFLGAGWCKSGEEWKKGGVPGGKKGETKKGFGKWSGGGSKGEGKKGEKGLKGGASGKKGGGKGGAGGKKGVDGKAGVWKEEKHAEKKSAGAEVENTAATASEDKKDKPICRHFQLGTCMRGDNCRFLHRKE